VGTNEVAAYLLTRAVRELHVNRRPFDHSLMRVLARYGECLRSVLKRDYVQMALDGESSVRDGGLHDQSEMFDESRRTRTRAGRPGTRPGHGRSLGRGVQKKADSRDRLDCSASDGYGKTVIRRLPFVPFPFHRSLPQES
jgi:hypothetical protein